MSHSPIKNASESDSIVETLQSAASTVVEFGSEAISTAMDQSKAARKQVNKYVHKNPWAAIGVAAGAGLLVGLMLKRRSRTKQS